MSRPKISVIVPSYNSAQFVGQTIDSILGQTFPDFELIVTDDASTDQTVALVQGYRDPRLILIENRSNIGPAGNFNRGLEQARGEFIKVVPADDILYPACFKAQVAILEDPRYQGVAMVSAARDVIDARGTKLFVLRPKLHGRVPGLQAVRRTIRAGANLMGEPFVNLFRASLLSAVGGFDGSLPFMIDVDFWCRVLRHGDLYMIPEVLGAFRVSSGSLSFALLGSQTRQFCAFIRKVRMDPAYQLSRLDAVVGSVGSFVREVVRLGAYHYYLGQ